MREKAYRVYVTDCLRVLTENTAKYVQGNYVKMRYIEMIEPKPEETRTADEIINGIKKKLKGGES